MWRKQGLATYLVCLLLKQHQGVPIIRKRNLVVKKHRGIRNGLEGSVLCLQAAMDRRNPSNSFYLKLGFISHDPIDNGLSLTSDAFQKKIIEFPTVWVPPEKAKMLLFKLMHGRLTLPVEDVIDLTNTSDLAFPTTWNNYVYAKFPFYWHSMKRIESYVENCPILKWLSTEPLLDTDRPFVTTPSVSTTSGTIVGQHRATFDHDTWLKTDDMQFLVAFLMRNKLSSINEKVHVLDPTITRRAMDVYSLMKPMLQQDYLASSEESKKYHANLEAIP